MEICVQSHYMISLRKRDVFYLGILTKKKEVVRSLLLLFWRIRMEWNQIQEVEEDEEECLIQKKLFISRKTPL